MNLGSSLIQQTADRNKFIVLGMLGVGETAKQHTWKQGMQEFKWALQPRFVMGTPAIVRMNHG